MTAHALRYFVAVSEELHFGRAAARLHLTTPSLSEQVAKLEKQLGVELFVRSPRGVELTDAGLELLPLARAAMDAHDAVADWAAARARAQTGTVRVGVFAAVASAVRRDALQLMAARHPEMLLVSRRMGSQEQLAALRTGHLDVAFLPQPMPEALPGIRWATVSRQSRVLMLPAGHPLADRREVDLQETNGELFVMAAVDPAGAARWLVDPRADGSSPARGPVAADFEEVLDLVAAERGVNITGADAAQHYRRPGIVFVPLTGVEDALAALCWRADERDTAVLAYVATARRLAAAATAG
ncbi:LysR family transcriptional regulator [Modestobacter altitudinis]|uniref:LysR family transcriptional regulator n=1 Tax=Modestobacter altitudinis TaxID=2213158 RepID=UPI00148603AD|nr:LysR family transcriptional regulator [Modestobacter altitudinis]